MSMKNKSSKKAPHVGTKKKTTPSLPIVPVKADLHQKMLAFLMTEWGRKENRQLVGVDLLYLPGGGYKDDLLRQWERADEPEMFAEYVNIEKLVSQILEIAEGDVDTKPGGKHRYLVRTRQHMGYKLTFSFTLYSIGDVRARMDQGRPVASAVPRAKSAAQLDWEITEALKSPTDRRRDRETAASLVDAQIAVVRAQLILLCEARMRPANSAAVRDHLTAAVRSMADAVHAALTIEEP